MSITQKERSRLRDLAKQQLEIAHSPKMEQIVRDWKKHGRFDADSRPMITIELGTFRQDILPPLMECESEEAQAIEKLLLSNIVNHTLFCDDTVVNDYIGFSYGGYFQPFNLPVEIEHASSDGGSLGHHFVEQIHNLEQDFHKLQKSDYGIVNKREVDAKMAYYNDLLGDILPAKIKGSALYASGTQSIVHIMSMETMYMSMYDYPELFHQMMNQLADDYIAYFQLLEQEDCLRSTVAEERVAQGSYCFTDQLPKDKEHYTLKDVWGYIDSQETSGLSPDMYHEFIFPYYKKITDLYGRLSYGCCEAVDPIWEKNLRHMKNMGRVSISPWCNEDYMGEQLRGQKIVYLRKPTPNLIGVGASLDEEAVRQHFQKTVRSAQGCTLEIVQRDVYQIHSDYHKVRRYVELIRECCAEHRK